MGARRTGGARARERARMSFLIVVMFFAVFGLIVLTELLLVQTAEPRTPIPASPRDRPDYEQFQGEDYQLRGLGAAGVRARYKGMRIPGQLGGTEERLQLPPLANATPPEALWQPVGGTRYKFLVYSAFYEVRNSRAIRLIGATKTRGAERVWCRLWYSTNHSSTVQGKVKIIRENWNLKYSACFVLCPLRANLTAPDRVSLVARPRAAPANVLKVLRPPPKMKPPSGLVVCVKPLHFSYNRPLHLIEFIELNKILGATHFVMYNHTVGKMVTCVLEHYKKLGLLTLLPWQLNMVSQKEIRTEGQFAALNDCLYRSMYHYAYAALVDLDEFIIPRKHRTLPSMLLGLAARSDSRSAGAFSFQNAFFYLQWADEEHHEGDRPLSDSLVTQRKTRRRQKLHPHKQRSKYICRPERVLEAGNHFVWEFVPGSGALSVPPDQAILHHYRVCEFGGDDCVKTPSFVDRTALKYKEELSDNVDSRYEGLMAECSLPGIPTAGPPPPPPPPPSPKVAAPSPLPLSPPV